MKKVLFLILLICLILVGCVPSLNPLYTDKDLILLPGLEGTWIDQDKNLWEFSRNGDKSYILTLTIETENPQTFDTNLVNLNNHIFMDLYPNNLDSQFNGKPDMTKIHLMPMHSFSKVQLSANDLRINMLNPGWIQDLVKQGKLYISYQVSSNGDGMLTANPADIQSFLKTYADNPETFDGPKWQLTRYVKKHDTSNSTTSQVTSSLSLDTSSTANLSSSTANNLSSFWGNGNDNTYSILFLSPLSNRITPGTPFQLNLILDNPLETHADNLGLWIRYNPKAVTLQQDPPFNWDSTLLSAWSVVTSFHHPSIGELYIQFRSPDETKSLSGTLGTLEFTATGKVHDSPVQFRFNNWGSIPNTFMTYKNKDVLGKELEHTDGTIGATIRIQDSPNPD